MSNAIVEGLLEVAVYAAILGLAWVISRRRRPMARFVSHNR
jgi:hypothetical protein